MITHFSTTDLALARRIEAGHASSGRSFANAQSGASAAVEHVAGGCAVFTGVGSPATQALAIGMDGPVAPDQLDRIEEFFHQRGSPAVIDLCTLADASVFALIQERGYTVREISNVVARRLDRVEPFAAPAPDISVSAVTLPGKAAWAKLVMQGFLGNDVSEDRAAMLDSTPESYLTYFGLLDREPAAGAAMELQNGMATLFGDATLATARGRGLQFALINHRLAIAAEAGCALASASVVPGSISSRNYERAGFQLLYLRLMIARVKN